MSSDTRNINQNYWRSDRFPQVELRTTYRSGQSYKKHSHNDFSIGAVIEGETETTIKNRLHQVKTGELVIIEPKLIHSCNPPLNQKRSYHMMYLDRNWCLERLSLFYGKNVDKIQCRSLIIRKSALFGLYLELVNAMHKNQYNLMAKLLDSISFIIFSRYCSPSVNTDSGSKLSQYVKLRLLDDLAQPPSLSELASELNIREETIIRAFNRQIGISPKAFLNNARIEQAKLNLKAGMDIIDVALKVGFSDQSHFHKTFVNFTSSTPRQYQKINF